MDGGALKVYSGEVEVTCHSDRVCLSGSGASVDRPEQESRGRPSWLETHRQAEAPHTRSPTGKMMKMEGTSLNTLIHFLY